LRSPEFRLLACIAMLSCSACAVAGQAAPIIVPAPAATVQVDSGKLPLRAFASAAQHAKKSARPGHKPGNRIRLHVPAMVRIPGRNYEMGKFEVTQAEWRAVMHSNPSYFSKCGGNCPVESVSWEEISEFIRRLDAATGRHYRLPTGEEWLYACYGGRRTDFCGGDTLGAVGWFDGDSIGHTHPVGRKKANGYGLYDMSGNVWESTSDCYDDGCTQRLVRGGSWKNIPLSENEDVRYNFGTKVRYDDLGFRLARTLP
jgi:formylglycine-generating enzyme required for sulfatase activity